VTKLDITPQPHQQRFLDCNGKINKKGALEDSIRIVFFGGGAK
jgi:hypothetical protein